MAKYFKVEARLLPVAKTDSILFNVSFEDDVPGTVYRVSGYKRTGFLEDEQ